MTTEDSPADAPPSTHCEPSRGRERRHTKTIQAVPTTDAAKKRAHMTRSNRQPASLLVWLMLGGACVMPVPASADLSGGQADAPNERRRETSAQVRARFGW